MGKLYVAYGSNLNLAQMNHRCPTAIIYAKGILNNWELVYRGSITNSHATIQKKKGESVPVIVWEIQPEDEQMLDIYEGYPNYYFKKNIMVNINGRNRKAMVYIMNPSMLPGTPSVSYIRTIAQGYFNNNLDISYLEKSLLLNRKETKRRSVNTETSFV